jgi:threonine aldolase
MIPAPLNAAEQESLRRRCTIHVSGHALPEPGAELARIGLWCQEHGWHADRYGEGELIEGFERRVATLLGKAAAVFMPSGTMAQLIALRIWCERRGIRRIAMHATSHLELHEERAYAHLHGLDATLLGGRERPTEAHDLAALLAKSAADSTEPPAALLVELPAREIGGRLPAWEEIEALSALAHDHGMRMHMDGARLWEAREYFAPRSLADLCAPFDSVYVSFYKGIGALAGAMLLGREDFIAEARIWRRRQGGTLVQLHPFVASAAMRLDMQLAKMPAYRARALGFAAGLSTIDGIVVDPQPPQVNLFHVHFAAPPAALTAARDRIASEDGAWLAQRFGPGNTPGGSSIEIYVGDNVLAHDDATVIPLFAKLLELAHSQTRAASSLVHSNMLAAT